MLANGATTNDRTNEGTLVTTLLFEQAVVEGVQIQEGIKCFKRAQNGVKLSPESEAFYKGKAKEILDTNFRSSVVLKKEEVKPEPPK